MTKAGLIFSLFTWSTVMAPSMAPTPGPGCSTSAGADVAAGSDEFEVVETDSVKPSKNSSREQLMQRSNALWVCCLHPTQIMPGSSSGIALDNLGKVGASSVMPSVGMAPSPAPAV